MLTRYKNFLEKFNKKIDRYFEEQSEFVNCKKGCANCCEVGEYPFSRLELEFLMSEFAKIPFENRLIIKENIDELKNLKTQFKGERFSYQCPFLINKECAIYNGRGITCRCHGLAYVMKDGKAKLPFCAEQGLNYSECFNKETGEVFIDKPVIEESLSLLDIFKSELAEEYDLEFGEIRPLINWF